MSRTSLMSIGFFLLFMGIQLHVVESFTMTRRVSNFLTDNFPGDEGTIAAAARSNLPQFGANDQNYNSPYYQASYTNSVVQIQPTASATTFSAENRTLQPPRWICWPVLFLGAVMILQGLLRT